MQSNRLIDGAQIVKPIRPRRADAKAEVDLGEGSDGDSHGVLILTTEDMKDTEAWRARSFIRKIRVNPWLNLTSFSCSKS